jgi:hypothetical protein
MQSSCFTLLQEETSNGFFNKRGRHRMTVLAVKDLKVGGWAHSVLAK